MTSAERSGSPLPSTTAPAPAGSPATPAFPYRIEAKIGEGSMGVVYRAVEPTLGRPVAIKVLKADPALAGGDDAATREMRLRFLQEARSAAAIQHPGAVTIYRVGQASGLPFIAMEWLDGETLAERLARTGPLQAQQAVDLALQTLDALQAAHDAGVVHRDIKPSNLILLKDGRVKVTDFGIAQFRSANLLRTEAGLMLGTPGYAAPEQLRGEEVDARSDLYSLGMVLYEALTGKIPFAAASLLELATKVLRETPPALSTLRPDLPLAVAQIFTQALSKDRAERWASAGEMAAALLAVAPPAVSRRASSSGSGWGQGGTIALPRSDAGPIYRGLPTQLPLAVAHLVLTWPAQSLAAQPVDRLLARLLDRPLHAPAFSGALAIEGKVLLFHDGHVLGAIDRRTGRVGDAVAEEMVGEGSAQLHPVPEGMPAKTIEVLSGLLGTTRVRQSGLDSTLVHLPGLAERLAAEPFDGVLRLQREADEGRVVVVGGQTVLAFFSGSWTGVDVDRTWTRWIGEVPVVLDVEEVSTAPLALSWRLRSPDLELACERKGGTPTGRSTTGSGSFATRRLPLLARRLEPKPEIVTLVPVRETDPGVVGWRGAPPVRLLEWLLTEGAAHFSDSKVAARWKYLAEWLPLVARARLYVDLAPDGPRRGQRFDLATFDLAGKVLHLAHRFPRATPESFRRVLARVIEAKEALLEGGDIGGVVFVAPEFPPEVVALYLETVERQASGFRRLQENVTGYAGFVRVGPRRGFHLLLVEERAGGFAPLDV